jgi:serpin B
MRRSTLAIALAVMLNVPADAADTDVLVRGNTEFAFDLYDTLRVETRDDNLFFSPYSVSTAVAMTYAGARGATAEQIARACHFALPPARLHPAFRDLMTGITGGEYQLPYELYTANALWGQRGYDFQRTFVASSKEHYGAALNQVDFAKAAEDARRTINKWVEEQTKNKIIELLPNGVIDTMTRLVLTNAVYFLGNWELPFDLRATRDGEFHVSDNTTVTVPLMHHDSDFRYMRNNDVIALDLPYKGQGLSMILLLPPEKTPLTDLEKKMTPDNLEAWLRAMKPGRVMVTLPKFKVESQFSLKSALSRLGMPLAFSTKADLSGISSRRDLQIAAVVHKAYVDVNELGTEAAAATGIGLTLTSLPPRFTADRPFVFLIRDNRSGSVLFLGRLMNPAR